MQPNSSSWREGGITNHGSYLHQDIFYHGQGGSPGVLDLEKTLHSCKQRTHRCIHDIFHFCHKGYAKRANGARDRPHYNDVIMDTIASQITSLTIVFSTVYSDADQRKHQTSASLALVSGIHQGSVNSPHKWPITRKMFPLDDVIMACHVFVDALNIRLPRVSIPWA